ncbi:MAG TPA: hypothetical protein VIO61_02745 [Anaerolineaceae bacterium]
MNPQTITPTEAETFERDPFPQPRTIPNGWIVEAIYEGETNKADSQPRTPSGTVYETKPR